MASQFEDIPFNGETPSNMVVIRFMLFKQVGSQSIDAPADQIAWDEITVVTDKYFKVSPSDFVLPSSRDGHTEMLAELLSNEIGVPEVKQPTIINQIFLAVEQADIPGVPVTSIISDATIRYYGDDQTRVDRVVSERRQPKCIIPATKSSIEHLEKVRLENFEATIRSIPCVICKERLDRSDDGVDEDQLMITRLPCLHIYHGDCIVQWLETSNLCPLCRYPMPFMEEAHEPSKDSKPSTQRRLSWPMLLTASAGGVIAAVLLCRLLKPS